MATTAEQRSFYNADNEVLIEEVKKITFLYDKADPRYKDSVARDNAWEEIGRIIGQNAESTKKRWELLRDSFSRAIRRCRQIPLGKIDQDTIKWRYSKLMWFLYEYISPRKAQPSMYYSSADSRALVSAECAEDHDSLNSLTEFAINCSPPPIDDMDEEDDDGIIDDDDGEHSPSYLDGPPSLRPQDEEEVDDDGVYRDLKPRRKMPRWQLRQQQRHHHQQMPSSTMQGQERLLYVKENSYGGSGGVMGAADSQNCPIEMFCRSLVPHFKRVPDSQLLLAQTAVMQALSPYLQFNNNH